MRIAIRLALASVMAVAGFGAVTIAKAHSAPPPNGCQSTSDQPRTYTHGSPLTGLQPPDDYYYLSVETAPGCELAPGTPVHLVATIQVREVVPSVGASGFVPSVNRDQMWWTLFHLGSGEDGDGFSLTNDAQHVTMSGGTVMPCTPPPQLNPQACLCTFGTQTITMDYHGPDVFGLEQGGSAGFRISNMAEDGAIVTDFATLTIER